MKKNITTRIKNLLFVAAALLAVNACKPKIPTEYPLVIKEDSTTVRARAKEIRENTAAQLAEGFRLELWATDSLAQDPIALDIDDFGSIYLTSTNRQKNSEFDIRGHRDWMTASIALESVEDRRSFLRKTFATEKSDENTWLKDLNQDSVHDWRDLTVEKEEIWKLEDTNGNGMADVSTRVLHDFHEEVTDVAGALLVRRNDIFLGVGPDMWRLKDKNKDGVFEDKTSISHGYGVHIGFGGHGMSGATEGPDGKIYWGIGDIGANITTKNGEVFKYPNQGVIVRSNPDGSNFEVFAAGLRNTHEFVFDNYGNLISADNDGDHRGESERLVHIVEGHDAGWRANWQYGKYTDPKNNGYSVWMDEVLYKPRWEGQAAYIIPPLTNYHNGPTGMTFNPGTALSSKWKDHFFLVEFVGNPSRSHIWAFTLKPKGASFQLANETDIVSGVLPTGMRFGPDGALYFSDWINGWDTKDYGRVWKLDVYKSQNDLAEERLETQGLLKINYSDQSESELLRLLGHGDRRIRQKSQFELATRGKRGFDVFEKAIQQTGNQLMRIHAIWGIGQLASKKTEYLNVLVSLLKDPDAEIVAQSAKVIGDLKYAPAATELTSLLDHNQSRARFFAAQALGRIKYKAAVGPILAMIEKNNDEDVYIRHAGVLALSRIGEIDPIIALANHPKKTQRLTAVLVLRRMRNEQVALFLNDQDEYIVTEAARAINDDWSIETALPRLAEVLNEDRFTSEPLLRRAINAALRVGGDKELDLLISFANRKNLPKTLRAEALFTLGTWANPSVLDRVDGRYRGEITRDDRQVKQRVNANMVHFLKESDPQFLAAVASMLSELDIRNYSTQLKELMVSNPDPGLKSAIIEALVKLQFPEIISVIRTGMEDENIDVRTTALGYLNKLDISKENLPTIINPIFNKGTIKEQQRVLQVLGEMPVENTSDILEGFIDQLIAGKFSPELALDLSESVEATGSEKLLSKLSDTKNSSNTSEAFADALYGGNAQNGRRFVTRNNTAQCIRCHSIDGQGGMVGPSLTNIGNVLTREEILQALIEPSKRLSPGFGSVSLTLTGGQVVNGTLLEERKDELILQTSEAEPMEIPLSRIEKRRNNPSSMPPMGTIMSRREIRDVVEYLAGLKN